MNDELPRQVREEIDGMSRRIERLEGIASKVLRLAPGPSQEKARRNRLIYEIIGLAITSFGAWFVYPPAPALIVGGWMLAEVIASRYNKPKKDR